MASEAKCEMYFEVTIFCKSFSSMLTCAVPILAGCILGCSVWDEVSVDFYLFTLIK